MKFSTYIWFLFAVCLVLYYLQYYPMVVYFADNGQSIVNIECAEGDQFCQNEARAEFYRTSTVFGAMLLVIAGAGIALVALITGYSAIYIIPLLILMAILNFVVFPLGFVLDPTIPEFLKYPIAVFFNLMTVLATVSFIRGDA